MESDDELQADGLLGGGGLGAEIGEFEETSDVEAFVHDMGETRIQFAVGRKMKVSDVTHAPMAVCFLLHLAFVAVLILLGFLTGLLHEPNANADVDVGGIIVSADGTDVSVTAQPAEWDPYDDLWDYFTHTMDIQEIVRIWVACVICGGVAAAFSVVWFFVLCRFGRAAMYASLAMVVGICLAVSVFFILIGGVVLGGLLLFVNVVFLVAFLAWWKRLLVSSLLLSNAVVLLSEQGHGLFGLVFGCMGVYIGWFWFWAAAILLVQQFADFSVILVYASILYLLFSWYWTSGFIRNVCHTCVGGIVGIRCLKPDQLRQTKRPMVGLIKRALTVQLGSIAMGSTLSVPVEMLRNFVAFFQRSFMQCPRSDSNQCAPVRFFFAPFMWATEQMMAVFNEKAFVEIGLYGRSYFEAASGSFRLMLAFNVEQVLLDSLVTSVVWLGAVIGGLISGFVAAFMAWLMGSPYFFLVFLLGFLIGYGSVQVVLECVNAAIVAMLLSMCQVGPDRVADLFPSLYAKLHNLYGTSCYLFAEPPVGSEQKEEIPLDDV